MQILERLFHLRDNNTDVKTEILGGTTTFMTMAYIVFLNPALLSQTGMDYGAVMTATCLTAALATAIMGLYARYPIAQAPGMGENFVFALSAIPAAEVMIAAGVKSGALEPGTTTPCLPTPPRVPRSATQRVSDGPTHRHPPSAREWARGGDS